MPADTAAGMSDDRNHEADFHDCLEQQAVSADRMPTVTELAKRQESQDERIQQTLNLLFETKQVETIEGTSQASAANLKLLTERIDAIEDRLQTSIEANLASTDRLDRTLKQQGEVLETHCSTLADLPRILAADKATFSPPGLDINARLEEVERVLKPLEKVTMQSISEIEIRLAELELHPSLSGPIDGPAAVDPTGLKHATARLQEMSRRVDPLEAAKFALQSAFDEAIAGKLHAMGKDLTRLKDQQQAIPTLTGKLEQVTSQLAGTKAQSKALRKDLEASLTAKCDNIMNLAASSFRDDLNRMQAHLDHLQKTWTSDQKERSQSAGLQITRDDLQNEVLKLEARIDAAPSRTGINQALHDTATPEPAAEAADDSNEHQVDMSFEDLVDELMHKLGCSKETAVKLMHHIGDTSKMQD